MRPLSGFTRLALLFLSITGSAAFAQSPVISSLSAPRQTALVGQPLTLTVNATSSTPLSYQWRRNGLPISGATASSLALAATTARDSGWYQVVASNSSGSTISAVVFVSIAVSPAHVTDWGQYYNNELDPLPVPPAGLGAISRIAAAGGHSLALKHDGTVAAWGRHFEGQLNVPAGLNDAVAVAGGSRHSLALRSNGTVLAWGENTQGQTSVPATLANVVSVAGGEAHSLALRSDGTVIAWGANQFGEGAVPGGASNIIAIAAGARHNLALRADGTVTAWGANAYGESSVPGGLSNVIAIAAGFYHSLALRSNGTVVAWGRNDNGQSTVPGNLTDVVAIAGGSDVSLALRNAGTVVGWGSNVWEQLTLPAGLNQVVAIGAGSQQAIALRSSAGDATPVIQVHPASQTSAVGGSVTLSVTANGTFLRYQWRKNGVPLNHETSPTLIRHNLQNSSAGSYDVVVSNHIGSVTSNAAQLSIGGSPVFTTPLVSLVVGAGESATFATTATGISPLTYQWYKNGSPISGATQATYSIPNVNVGDVANYYVIATNPAGSNSSNAASLTLRMAPQVTTQPQSVVATVGQTVSFSVTAAANPAPTSIQWRKGGIPLAGNSSASTLTLLLPNVTAADAGIYDVVITNIHGSVTSQPAALAFPGAPVISAQPQSMTVNQGQRFTLGVSATASPAITGYQWRKDGVPITNSASATSAMLVVPEATLADAGAYDVVVTSPLGSVTSATARVTVQPLPAILAQPTPVTVVIGQSASFTVVARDALSYQWRKDGGAIATNPSAKTATLVLANVSSADRGSYDVVVSGLGGSVNSLPVALEVAPPAPSRLINVSVLTRITSATDTFVVGAVVGGAGTQGEKPLLIRAAGPSLAQLAVSNVLADPRLEFFRNSTPLGSNDNWGGAAELAARFGAFGAFPFSASDSRDAAMYVAAVARADHSVRISGVGGATGTVIAEIYDATPATAYTGNTPRLVNLSVLKHIDGGGLTAGFVIAGPAPKTILIRAIGPSLVGFNVSDFLPDPKLQLFNDAQTSIATNDDWGGATALSDTFTQVGAFVLPANSEDAALLQTLSPGAYTVQISVATGGSGTGLVEIYEVP